MVAMYAVGDSYMWQCKKQILQVLNKLKGRKIHTTYEIIGVFNEWTREQREEEMEKKRQLEEQRERERMDKELTKIAWAKDRTSKRNKSVDVDRRKLEDASQIGTAAQNMEKELVPKKRARRKSIKNPILLSFDIEIRSIGEGSKGARKQSAANKKAKKKIRNGREEASSQSDGVLLSSENTS